jgi:REP element-mobilizing transposase RayT
MPWGLKRYHGAGDLHFITCSCYRRQPLLGSDQRRDLFLQVLEQVRRRYQFVLIGYVVMPEHVHLLVSEPQQGNPSKVMQAVKLGFALRVLAQQRRRRKPLQASLFEHVPRHIWQALFTTSTSGQNASGWRSCATCTQPGQTRIS